MYLELVIIDIINNIVWDSEIEITFDSFNPTAGRLAAFLASQSKSKLTDSTHRSTQPPPSELCLDPWQVCSGQAQAARAAAGRAKPHERRAGGARGCLGGGRCWLLPASLFAPCLDHLDGRGRSIVVTAEAGGCLELDWVTQFSLLWYIWATIYIVLGQNIAKIKAII